MLLISIVKNNVYSKTNFPFVSQRHFEMKRNLKKMSDSSDMYSGVANCQASNAPVVSAYHSQYHTSSQTHYNNTNNNNNPNIHLHHHHHVIAPILAPTASPSNSKPPPEGNNMNELSDNGYSNQRGSRSIQHYQSSNQQENAYQSGADTQLSHVGNMNATSPIQQPTLPASCGSSSSSISSSSSHLTPYLSSTHPSPGKTHLYFSNFADKSKEALRFLKAVISHFIL